MLKHFILLRKQLFQVWKYIQSVKQWTLNDTTETPNPSPKELDETNGMTLWIV